MAPSTGERGGPNYCDCAHIPVEEKGDEHLADCPTRIWAEGWPDTERFKADLEEANRLFEAGDVEGLEAFANRNVRDRAHAATLRARHPRKEPPTP